MKVIICLDYNSATERLMSAAHKLMSQMKEVEIMVVHIIDESLFYGTQSADTRLYDQLKAESDKLKELCVIYFGSDVRYIEEAGMPRVKIDEILHRESHDLLMVGLHGKKNAGLRLVGGLTDHLMRTTTKPLLFIPD
jgi:nucleotide-binding universal stress UspA family protein